VSDDSKALTKMPYAVRFGVRCTRRPCPSSGEREAGREDGHEAERKDEREVGREDAREDERGWCCPCVH